MNRTADYAAQIRVKFSALLREAMTTQDKSVRVLADEIGVTPKTIQDLRDGRHTPGLDLAAALADRLGFDLDQVRG